MLWLTVERLLSGHQTRSRAPSTAGMAYDLATWLAGALPASHSTETGTGGALCGTICQKIRRVSGCRTVPLEAIVWQVV
jgi:hypothetical protein